MIRFDMKKQDELDELAKRLRESAKQERTSEEKRAQLISWCLSVVENPDEQTRKNVERIVDEVYR